jgi:hypothetical protein
MNTQVESKSECDRLPESRKDVKLKFHGMVVSASSLSETNNPTADVRSPAMFATLRRKMQTRQTTAAFELPQQLPKSMRKQPVGKLKVKARFSLS